MKNYTLKAIIFATEKHEGQMRKGSGLPYITHPLTVANIVSSFKKSKNLDQLVAAAILHDTLEDTDTSFAEIAKTFTPMIASLVLELTSDKEQIALVGKAEYMKKKWVGMSSYALTLKLADRLHNISDRPSMDAIDQTEEIIKHVKKHRKLSATQKTLAMAVLKECKKQVKKYVED